MDPRYSVSEFGEELASPRPENRTVSAEEALRQSITPTYQETNIHPSSPPSRERDNTSPIVNQEMADSRLTLPNLQADSPEDPAVHRRHLLFMIFVTLTQLVQMIPLGVGINSGLAIGEALGANEIQSVWIVASYPLTQGTFVLIGGRLGAIYGHKNILTAGCIWWVFWALAGGLSNNLISMSFMRGLCGIGGGLMIPNIVALLGITFPPGKMRNLSFALFGAMAPVGAAGGSLVSAIVVQLSEFKWLFLLLGLLGFVVYSIAIIAVDADEPVDPNGFVDWVGAYLGVTGLILFNYVWNQAPSAGWDNAYQIVLPLILSVLHLGGFVFWEAKIAAEPILPFTIWNAPSFGRLMVAIFFSFMSLGIYFWYMNVYMQLINGDSLIRVGVQYLPLTIVGAANAFFAAWLVPRVPAQVIIGIGCLAMVIINVLLATIPAGLTYWAMAFPAMFFSSFTIDLINTSAQIICSNTVPMKYQGVAGSLVGTLLGYGMSTGLGFAGTVESYTNNGGETPEDLLKGFHGAAYLAVGFSATSLVITFFIRIPRDNREGWDDESAKREQEREQEKKPRDPEVSRESLEEYVLPEISARPGPEQPAPERQLSVVNQDRRQAGRWSWIEIN